MLYAILYPYYRLKDILRVRYVLHYGITPLLPPKGYLPFRPLLGHLRNEIILKSDYVFIPFWDPQYGAYGYLVLRAVSHGMRMMRAYALRHPAPNTWA